MKYSVLSLLLFVFIFSSNHVLAQTNTSEIKLIDTSELYKSRDDKSFIYNRDLSNKKEIDVSWFDRWMNKLFIFLFSDQNKTKYTIYIIASIIAFVFLYILFKAKAFQFQFSNGKKQIKIDVSEDYIDVRNVEFKKLLNAAEIDKDFRHASRFLFLMLLKHFDEKKWIDFVPGKSNKQYLKEYNLLESKALFEDIVYYYEHVWYGNFYIDEAVYNRIKSKYKHFMPFEK